MTECKECAERREKIKAHLRALAEWLKNPTGAPPLLSKPPAAPQIHSRSNTAKKELSC